MTSKGMDPEVGFYLAAMIGSAVGGAGLGLGVAVAVLAGRDGATWDWWQVVLASVVGLVGVAVLLILGIIAFVFLSLKFESMS